MWESRVRILGADEAWQDVVNASFFYLYSSIHFSTPQSVAPFGLGQRDNYKGHVFWDTESFMAMLPLLTDLHSAPRWCGWTGRMALRTALRPIRRPGQGAPHPNLSRA